MTGKTQRGGSRNDRRRRVYLTLNRLGFGAMRITGQGISTSSPGSRSDAACAVSPIGMMNRPRIQGVGQVLRAGARQLPCQAFEGHPLVGERLERRLADAPAARRRADRRRAGCAAPAG